LVTRVLLARHGETDWNRDRRFQGHADPPLNASGRQQAAELADELAAEGVQAVYASDLRRALETAEIVGARLGLAVTTLPDLREVDVGEWEGLTVAEVERLSPEGLRRWRDDGLPGWVSGETFDDLAARMARALLAVGSVHPAGTALVISHGAAIRAVRAHAAGVDYGTSRTLFPAPMRNCDVVELEVSGRTIRVGPTRQPLAS
jgi:broad specificity phosphatase PhoE